MAEKRNLNEIIRRLRECNPYTFCGENDIIVDVVSGRKAWNLCIDKLEQLLEEENQDKNGIV